MRGRSIHWDLPLKPNHKSLHSKGQVMITRNLAGGLLMLLLGSVYLYFAYGIHKSALADTMGAGGVPRVYGWLMVGLSLILICQSLWAFLRNKAEVSLVEEWQGQGLKTLKAAGLLCFGIIYLLIVETLGYLLSIALLLLGVALYRGAPIGIRVVLTSIGGAIFIWVIFVIVLGVRMPPGILETFGL